MREAWQAADAIGVINAADASPEAVEAWAAAGAEHLIVMVGSPFDLDPVRRLLELTERIR